MKENIGYLFLLLTVIVFSCTEKAPIKAEFEGNINMSIYDYLDENQEDFSDFISILERGGVYKTLSAKNPDASGYSLFLPNNDAVKNFIDNNQQFSSLTDLLNDSQYVSAISRYHVLTKGIHSNEFPFGAFSDETLSEDLLTVNFVIESDTAYYKINNQSAVIRPNLEMSNGYIHIVGSVLEPVVYTSYGWLGNRPECSIFKEAVDLTGIRPLIDLNLKAPEQELLPPVTLLVETDEILNKSGINSIDDLINRISPENDDYTNPSNPLYNFVGYHVLKNNYFIDDFQGVSSNYNTNSEVPVLINGLGNDIAINKGKEIFDTIIDGIDSTFIDFVGFVYDNSNVITQSGSIHFIDRILELQRPSKTEVTFQFREDPIINTLRNTIGTFSLEDYKEDISKVNWTADEVFLVREGSESKASSDDYIFIDGDFAISYTLPQIVQGRYELIVRANSFSRSNALIEVFLDGKKVGSTIDLTRGGTANNPFQSRSLGTITFNTYAEHVIEIRSLIPGLFSWDYIRFTPA